LEEYCYREIELCDILVSIIGGRFGSGSGHEPYSISQMELKRALDAHKQVHIFVDKNVLAEHSTYLVNKDNEKVRFQHVDNIAVYKFLEEVHALPGNNPIAPFETAEDIVSYLKAQWAGIFQRLLKEEGKREEIHFVSGLRNSAETMNRLVQYLTEERKDRDEAIKTILLTTHPAFAAIKKVLNIPYRVYFTNIEELTALVGARSWLATANDKKDKNWLRWSTKDEKKNILTLKVSKSIFDSDGKLKVITKQDWNKDLVKIETEEVKPEDIPF
jgi:hypothetical protein